jgi:hypothetical protein
LNAQLPAVCSEMCASFRYSGSLSPVRQPPACQSFATAHSTVDRHASDVHVVHDLGQEHAIAQVLQRRHLHVRRQLVLEALRLYSRPVRQPQSAIRLPPLPPSLFLAGRTHSSKLRSCASSMALPRLCRTPKRSPRSPLSARVPLRSARACRSPPRTALDGVRPALPSPLLGAPRTQGKPGMRFSPGVCMRGENSTGLT